MRTRFQWNVTLQSERGEIIERPVSAYWSPDHDLTAEGVGHAAKAAAHLKSGKKLEYAVLAVARVGTEAPAEAA